MKLLCALAESSTEKSASSIILVFLSRSPILIHYTNRSLSHVSLPGRQLSNVEIWFNVESHKIRPLEDQRCHVQIQMNLNAYIYIWRHTSIYMYTSL